MKSVETADCGIATGQEKIAFITDEELWSRARLASEVNRLASGLVERGVSAR
jgi:non-ribosomal peptide synthetase component E (peptide arylation enzyme)